jgi:hypothetical protein
MKKISILLLLIISFLLCRNVDKEESEREKKKLITSPIFPLWLLGQRDKNEDPDCGGDVIGTLFGLNNYRRKYTKLEENQEVITASNFDDRFYQSSKKTKITITLVSATSTNTDEQPDCSNSGAIITSHCNGIYIADINRKTPLLLNQSYQYEPKIDTKNFLTTDRNSIYCEVRYRIKSEVQP